jgi:hypothetical protein
LVDGIVRFATRSGLAGRVVNIGNDGEYTIRQLAEITARLAGTELHLTLDPLPPDDPTRRKPDITAPSNTFEKKVEPRSHERRPPVSKRAAKLRCRRRAELQCHAQLVEARTIATRVKVKPERRTTTSSRNPELVEGLPRRRLQALSIAERRSSERGSSFFAVALRQAQGNGAISAVARLVGRCGRSFALRRAQRDIVRRDQRDSISGG